MGILKMIFYELSFQQLFLFDEGIIALLYFLIYSFLPLTFWRKM